MIRFNQAGKLTTLSFIAGTSFLLVLLITGEAEAIPPPELIRIGSIFTQALAVALVFLSSFVFLLRKYLVRLFAAMKSGRRILIILISILSLVAISWSASAVYVSSKNKGIRKNSPSANASALVEDGVIRVAGMEFDITDPEFALPPREAAKLLGGGSHIFIDIREPVEFTTRHVSGFTNIRTGDLMAGGEYRHLDKTKTIVLLCEIGERGSAIAAFLRVRGYKAFYIDKGIRGWIESDLPFDGSAEMRLPDFNNKYTKISPAEAKSLIEKNKAVLIDVQAPGEFEKEHLPGAVNIPLANLPSKDLEAALNMLPKDKLVAGVAYDRFGAYYCLVIGWMLNQRNMIYGGTVMMPSSEQAL